ncbi:MAG TPA: Trk system potassium transporter TrkA [Bacteroidetes bacterium]|nr:Trk system potassium transporter TrkA [Bacteroidota bacterium]
MRIIVAGAGEVGSHLAKMLSQENHDLVVIDPNESLLQAFDNRLDLMTVHGSATSISTLEEASVRKTDLFISVAHLEDTNITACILGKKLGAKKTIARIDNQEYLLPNNKEFFRSLGVDHLIYPEKIAAREIVGLLSQTGTSEFFDFSGGKLSLFALKLDEDAPVINKTLMEATENRNELDYRAVAITRNGDTLIPRGDDVFEAEDVVYVITNRKGVNSLLKYSGKENFEINNLMIIGGSRIGLRTAKDLENEINVKLIEIDQEKSIQLAGVLDNTLVIQGDGRNINLLMDEGLKNMDAFVAVTGNSEANILACMLAKRMGVRKTIAEIENLDYIEMAERMGIDAVINKKLITASRISRFTMSAEVTSIKCLTGTDAEVMEFVVKPGARATRVPLKELEFPRDSIIGGVVRGERAFIAKGDTQIEPNDHVVVFALPSAIGKIDNFFN